VTDLIRMAVEMAGAGAVVFVVFVVVFAVMWAVFHWADWLERR
jgi:small neutral amino acid transporter SnatA (MarC family)